MKLRYHTRQDGFTLLEMMLVVALIGLTVTFIGLRFDRNPDKAAQLEAQRFKGLLEQLRDESLYTGRPYAIQIDLESGSYTFYRVSQQWSEIVDDDLFKTRTIPHNLSLSYEDPLPSSSEQTPRIVVEALAGVSPFRLGFIGKDWVYLLEVDDRQRLTITEHEYEES